jgi:NAD(P)-dependent dehydrogenase (short-subunit alcohol dehydrogenase family)
VSTIAIVGAGPGLGFSIAERFGREGFQVALISRSRQNLDAMVTRLAGTGIDAAGFAADVLDTDSLRAAIGAAKARFGTVDVLEYSPTPGADTVLHALEITEANAQYHVSYSLLGAIAVVREVLPEMIERGAGTLLFTTGASAALPMPTHASVGLGMSALRNYTSVLSAALRDTGVTAGMFVVATLIQKGTPGDPDLLAGKYWDMHVQRGPAETVVGDVDLLTAMEGSLSGRKASSTDLDALLTTPPPPARA